MIFVIDGIVAKPQAAGERLLKHRNNESHQVTSGRADSDVRTPSDHNSIFRLDNHALSNVLTILDFSRIFQRGVTHAYSSQLVHRLVRVNENSRDGPVAVRAAVGTSTDARMSASASLPYGSEVNNDAPVASLGGCLASSQSVLPSVNVNLPA